MSTVSSNGISPELRGAIRKEAIQQVSKWLIGGIVIVLGAAGFGWWLFLKPIIVTSLGGVPSGAVAAFDLAEKCPRGWDDFSIAAGRTIVDVGKGDGLTDRPFRQLAGSEQVALQPDQLPQHTHPISTLTIGDAFGKVGFTSNSGAWFMGRIWVRPWNQSDTPAPHDNTPPNLRTEVQGGSVSPVQIMPPYLALRFCKKA